MGRGPLDSLCRAYAERSTLFPTAASGLNFERLYVWPGGLTWQSS